MLSFLAFVWIISTYSEIAIKYDCTTKYEHNNFKGSKFYKKLGGGIFFRVRKREREGESIREIERDKREEEKVLFLIMFRSYDLT